ncbi:hypothetical protein [Nocardia cyriacigeorgica]|uniref:hypothetical protein n=1 Tax=Nocardia cyriacigeorgica TaxID=135487 RepID=UPI0024589E4B|nr:hypothetical protein [Nocardia cyriacigeorgica]
MGGGGGGAARPPALARRHASLLAIERAAPGERAARLELLAQVPDRAAARSAIIAVRAIQK